MNFDLVDVSIEVIWCIFNNPGVLLVYRNHAIVIILELKSDWIHFVNLQEAETVQRVNHLTLSFHIQQLPLRCLSQAHDVDACLGQADVVFVLGKKEPTDLALPELKRFVPVEHGLALLTARDVQYKYIVGVDVDRFVTDNKLFVWLASSLVSTPKDVDVGISDV